MNNLREFATFHKHTRTASSRSLHARNVLTQRVAREERMHSLWSQSQTETILEILRFPEDSLTLPQSSWRSPEPNSVILPFLGHNVTMILENPLPNHF